MTQMQEHTRVICTRTKPIDAMTEEQAIDRYERHTTKVWKNIKKLINQLIVVKEQLQVQESGEMLGRLRILMPLMT